MSHKLFHRRLWSDLALSRADLLGLLGTAEALKQTGRRNSGWRPLTGRHVALLCESPGPAADLLRRAVGELGGTLALLNTREWRPSAGTGVPEAARLLGRLYDAIDCCDLPLDVVEQIDLHAGVPVFDGLSCAGHPLRLIAGLMTMCEASGRALQDLRLRVDGDPRTPRFRAASKLAALAGVAAPARSAAPVSAMAGTDDAPTDDVDYVLDTAGLPPGEVVAVHAPAGEQARVAALLAENHRRALQAPIVSVLG